jgi:hypothetical protein
MKEIKGSVRQALKDYWRNLMHSAKNNKISRGAANICTMIASPIKDAWRRKDHMKKGK